VLAHKRASSRPCRCAAHVFVTNTSCSLSPLRCCVSTSAVVPIGSEMAPRLLTYVLTPSKPCCWDRRVTSRRVTSQATIQASIVELLRNANFATIHGSCGGHPSRADRRLQCTVHSCDVEVAAALAGAAISSTIRRVHLVPHCKMIQGQL
jgi:hypothetical protein